MVVFNDGLFLAALVAYLHLALAATFTAAASAAEMLVGVQTQDLQAVDFGAFERFVGCSP